MRKQSFAREAQSYLDFWSDLADAFRPTAEAWGAFFAVLTIVAVAVAMAVAIGLAYDVLFA